MVNTSTSWKNTSLWRSLEQCKSPGADAVRAALSADKCMNTIEAWLKHSASEGTADFTLHDDEHGYRVAQRMAEVVPANAIPKLSAYELALLLMSAYLHDIGMAPRRGLVKELWNYLAFGPGPAQTLNNLPPGLRNEVPEFRRYLDDNGVEPGLLSHRQSASVRGSVDELVAYYCRRRHNEWSKTWINDHLQGQHLGEFHSWIDDLTDLCLSHHHGKNKLLSERFDPRPVSNAGEMVNLRYLACILRVADILENDPKRTPEIVFQQRDVQSSSRIYWFKDHEFRCKIEPAESGGGRKLIVSARPKRAAMERACRDTMDAIAAELKLCRDIHEEKPFNHARGQRCEQYTWDLLDLITDDIRNATNDYIYINGAFRPDTKRILQLLSGNALYREPLASVRELLQNAFDAVRESLAHERLAFWDNLRVEEQRVYDWSSHDDIPHTVTLRFESEAGPDGVRTYWLTCIDDGVGMSRSILERHLLISGAAPRAELRDLERRCESAGFSLGRTGQFGIGVLSYFMLANRVELWTRRDARAGSEDVMGWYFETDGVGAFGELRKAFDARPGTKVRLRLREDQIGEDVSKWIVQLCKYVRKTLVRIPCRFRFDDAHEGTKSFSFERGWTSSMPDQFDMLVSRDHPNQPRRNEHELITSTERQTREAEDHEWEQLREEMRRAIRWEEASGELPERLGHFRVHIAYFELNSGTSLVFLREFQDGRRLLCIPFNEGFFKSGLVSNRPAWKGMKTEFSFGPERNFGAHMAVVEIDFTSPKIGAISVDRDRIKKANPPKTIFEPIHQSIQTTLRSLAKRIAAGKYLLISQSCIKFHLNAQSPSLYWPWVEQGPSRNAYDKPVELVRVTEPCTTLELAACQLDQINGSPHTQAQQLPRIRPYRAYGESTASIAPSRHLLTPNRIVMCLEDTPWGTREFHVTALRSITKLRTSSSKAEPCKFPPTWEKTAAVITEHGELILNNNNSLVTNIDQHELARLLHLSVPDLHSAVIAAQSMDMSNRGAAATLLIACAVKSVQQKSLARGSGTTLWQVIRESANVFINNAWRLFFDNTPQQKNKTFISILSESSGEAYAFEFSPSSWREFPLKDEPAEASAALTNTGPEWIFRIPFSRFQRSPSATNPIKTINKKEHATNTKPETESQPVRKESKTTSRPHRKQATLPTTTKGKRKTAPKRRGKQQRD